MSLYETVRHCTLMAFSCESGAYGMNECVAQISDYRFLHNPNGHAILIKVADHGQ